MLALRERVRAALDPAGVMAYGPRWQRDDVPHGHAMAKGHFDPRADKDLRLQRLWDGVVELAVPGDINDHSGDVRHGC